MRAAMHVRMPNNNEKPGSEVARDAKRDDSGPKQHGRQWSETSTDDHRPPPADEGLGRDTKPTREKYAPTDPNRDGSA
jgi:hypothetical protein